MQRNVSLKENSVKTTMAIALVAGLFCFTAELSAKQKQSHAKEKNISLNFQNIPVRSLLQIVAEHNGYNLVVSDAIEGNLTLHLNEVSWQKALETILRVKGLAKQQVGNILLIAPSAEMNEQKRLALEKAQQTQALAPLASRVIKVNHANAEILMEMLKAQKNNNDETKFLSLLSERGSIAVDTRTNSLIIKETAHNLEAINRLITELDVPVEQVEIEARIVSVDLGTLDDIGVRWGLKNIRRNYQLSSSIEANSGVSDLPIDEQLNVNLGAISPNAATVAFQVASLSKDLLLDLELSALQAESKAEVISSPRLLTTNKRPAYIEQGTELPYLESSSSGAASVTFKKAVLSLAVKPQITHDKKLILDLDVTQDRPAATVQAGTGEAVSINTQRISTQVLVDDQETVMLGGIYQNEMQEVAEKIPFLGDFPLVGRFFRHNYETLTKRELLIFVTPRIIVP